MTEKVITVLLKKHPREEHLFLTHVERKEKDDYECSKRYLLNMIIRMNSVVMYIPS